MLCICQLSREFFFGKGFEALLGRMVKYENRVLTEQTILNQEGFAFTSLFTKIFPGHQAKYIFTRVINSPCKQFCKALATARAVARVKQIGLYQKLSLVFTDKYSIV